MKIAIIPARGGSKRIKNKNIIDFHGKPMIAYPLEAARQSNLFNTIHVSTDDDLIQSTVVQLGFPVEFKRISSLADDYTAVMPVLQWVLTEYEKRGHHFQTICLMLPCAPLVEAEDIIKAYEIFEKHDQKFPLMAVSRFPVPIEWAYTRDKSGQLTPVSPGSYAIRSQDFSIKYYDSGSFYFYNRAHIMSEKPVTDKEYIAYELPKSKVVDIDEEEDLEFARALYFAREHKS